MSSSRTAPVCDLNSTNGRTYIKVPKAATLGFQGLAALWPGQAERLAAWMFCHPHRPALPSREAELLKTGSRVRFVARGLELAAWSWGDGPTVLLHHGWSGRAAQLGAFVDPLVRAGYRVVAYDAPAHGASPGRTTGLPVLAETLREFESAHGEIHAVVAHSVGCAATMLAIRQGLSIQRAVLLAPPADMRVFLTVFADCLGMSGRVRGGMTRRIAARFDIDWAEMDAGHWARRERPPLLVFHDREDRTVPWEHGLAVREAWRNANLITTEGLGHRRIRRHPSVVERAVAFLARPGVPVSLPEPGIGTSPGASAAESASWVVHPG
jgi:pimeloyl-ACP methyl ester carboxylesterase